MGRWGQGPYRRASGLILSARVPRLIAIIAVLFAWMEIGTDAVLSRPARAAEPLRVEITEWPVPWKGTRPRDPYVDRQHRVWFVGQFGDYVARLDPATGEFTRFDLEPHTRPHNVIVDEQGMVWYAGIESGHIGKLDPTTGRITKFPMPDPAARDPHTLLFDDRGNIWFTVIASNFIGKLAFGTGQIRLIPLPTSKAFPYGIVMDRLKRPWFTEFGVNQLGTVDPVSMTVREIPLPRAEARCRRLAATSNGEIWYGDYAKGFLGRLEPSSGQITEWPLPGGAGARPYGMTVDDRDRLWFVETGPQPNRLVGFDPATSSFFSVTEIKSGGGAVRNMFYYQSAREIWFGTDASTIGRAKVP